VRMWDLVARLLKREDVSAGQVLAKPGSYYSHTEFLKRSLCCWVKMKVVGHTLL